MNNFKRFVLTIEASENPDLIVLYHAATETELNTMGTGGWGARWGTGMSTTTVEKIPVGQLTVDIGDAKTKKLLWMGTANETLKDDPDKAAKQKRHRFRICSRSSLLNRRSEAGSRA